MIHYLLVCRHQGGEEVVDQGDYADALNALVNGQYFGHCRAVHRYDTETCKGEDMSEKIASDAIESWQAGEDPVLIDFIQQHLGVHAIHQVTE